MANSMSVKRSGFLSQLLHGRPTYVSRPPRIFEDFTLSVLALSDTSFESHRILAGLNDLPLDKSTIETNTATHILKIQKNADSQDVKKKTYKTGVGPFSVYYAYENAKFPDKKTNFYEIFSTTRKGLFGLFKVIDDVIRIPSLFFAACQILLERAGWKLQVSYKKTNNLFLKGIALSTLGPIGLCMNVLGTVARAGVFVTKIGVEAIRVPLAIAGGVIGLCFGGIVAIFQNVLNVGNRNALRIKSVSNSVFQGMLDGIRPFAPEFANELQCSWVKTSMPGAILRYPFEKMSTDNQRRNATINLPWFSIAMFALAVGAVLALSMVSFGFGGMLGMPLLPYLFQATGLAAGSTLTANLTLATMGLMAIGGIQAALVGVGRGIMAFFNDATTQPAAEILVPSNSLPSNNSSNSQTSSSVQNPTDKSSLLTIAAPVTRSDGNSHANPGKGDPANKLKME